MSGQTGACPGPACWHDLFVMALSKLTVLNDKYVLRDVLGGKGEYDTTYLAWNLSKERNAVVIREFSPSFIAARSDDGAQFSYNSKDDRAHFEYGLNCFVREAAATALIDHPNVVKHEDYFRENETSYCVSTHHPGATLSTVLESQQGTIEERAAYAIIMPLLDGLLAGHRQGLIHGRLSPGQIILTKTGRPMLYRFHVTRLLLARRCGRVLDMNESGFTPPELLVPNGKKGPWSDIYSCGATLYAIISGEKPPDALNRHEKDPFLDILHHTKEISPRLKKVIYRATSMHPEERPQSVLELKQELRRAMMHAGADSVRGPVKGPAATSYPFGDIGLSSVQSEQRTADPEVKPVPGNEKTESRDRKPPIYTLNAPSPFRKVAFQDPSGARQPFVETNPLGPFADERLVLSKQQFPGNALQSASSPTVETAHRTNALRAWRVAAGIALVVLLGVWGVSGRLFERGITRDALVTSSRKSFQLAYSPGRTDTSLSGNPAEKAGALREAYANDLLPGLLEGADSLTGEGSGATPAIDSVRLGEEYIQRGDSSRMSQRLDEAQWYYQVALTFLPRNTYVDSVLEVVSKDLQEASNAMEFERFIETAERLVAERDYAGAIRSYQRAQQFAPNAFGVKEQIASLRELLEYQQKREQRYQYFIGQGDGLLKEGNYEGALNSYIRAREMRPDDAYARMQVQAARDSLARQDLRIEKQKDLYAFHRLLGDSLYEQSDLNGAFVHYQAALAQDPSDQVVLDRLVEIQQARKEKELSLITDEEGVFIATEVPPRLLDEQELIRQIEYPAEAKRMNIEGRVILRMIVNKDGSVSDVKIARGIGFACDREALRVMKKAKFIPAEYDGEPVRAWHTYAIAFRLLR